MEKQDPLIGTMIRDYALVRLLGTGASGMVYLAQHSTTHQEVAIKFLVGEWASQEEFIRRFINEAKLCASLQHENIIHVYEGGEEDQTHFMIMEYVNGTDLTHFLEVHDKVKEGKVVPWLKQAARGLSYAHSHGIIHRDLKPANIMLTKDGLIKIADLGLSKNLSANDNSSMTMSGSVIGTPYYISPEQARNSKNVGARTDIYSLGATFYHLVTGDPPFRGDSSAEVMAKHMNEQIVQPQRKNPALSDGFCDLLDKMLKKEPDDRLQTMEEVVQAVERLEKGEKVIKSKFYLKPKDKDEPLIETAAEEVSKGSFLKKILRNKLLIKGTAMTILLLAFSALFFLDPSDSPHAASSPPVAAQPTQPVQPVQPTQPTESSEPTEIILPGVSSSSSQNSPELFSEGDEKPLQPKVPEKTTSKTASSWISMIKSIPSHPFNGMDLFTVFALFVGIVAAKQVGLFWGSIRAIAFWAATLAVLHWFHEFALFLQQTIAFQMTTAVAFAYIILSAVLVLSVWMATHRLREHQKLTWLVKLEDHLTIIPGLILGMAMAVWLTCLLGVLSPSSFPIEKSWIGSQVIEKFPMIEKVGKVAP